MLPGIPSLLNTSRGEFSPTQVTGLFAWYNAAAIVANDGDGLSVWNDSFGTNHLSVFDASKKPVFKTNIVNGQPVVRFNGVDPTAFTLDWADKVQPITIFIVGKQTAKTSAGRFIDSPPGARELLGMNTSGFFDMYAGTASLNDATDHSGAFHILTGIFNGASSFGYVDGTQVVSGNPGSGGMSKVYVGSDLGTGATLNGDIAEILFYSVAMSAINKGRIESSLKGKYGLT